MKTHIVGAVLVAGAIGLAIGIMAYTFLYAHGASYLKDDPAACANCHVMREYYDGWLKGSHRSVATCNSCHTPGATVPKYATKAANGFLHSLAFTTGNFPEPLQIRDFNKEVVEGACRACHRPMVLAMDGPHQSEKLSCVRCHSEVGHR